MPTLCRLIAVLWAVLAMSCRHADEPRTAPATVERAENTVAASRAGEARKALSPPRLEGVWRLVSAKAGDWELTSRELPQIADLFVFDGQELAVIANGRVIRREGYVADTATAPMRLDEDFPALFGLGPKESLLSIFKIEANELTLCASPSGSTTRPVQFRASGTEGTSLLRFVRAEPDERPAPQPPLAGVWRLERAWIGDQELPPQQLAAMKRLDIYVGGRLTVILDGKVESCEPYTVDADADSCSLDSAVVWSGGLDDQSHEPLHEIFKIERDRLTICSPYATHNVRPKEFRASGATQTNLAVFVRAKPGD